MATQGAGAAAWELEVETDIVDVAGGVLRDDAPHQILNSMCFVHSIPKQDAAALGPVVVMPSETNSTGSSGFGSHTGVKNLG